MLWSPFNKFAGLKVCVLIKKETPAQLLSCECCEILNSSYFIERLTTLGTKLTFFTFLVSYTISESAGPFSFLNGVRGKWCKLDFELYGILKKYRFL